MLQSESKDYKGPISQLQQSADKSSLLLSLFMLFGASIDWPRPTCIREGKLLYSVCTLTITFGQMGTPADTKNEPSRPCSRRRDGRASETGGGFLCIVP